MSESENASTSYDMPPPSYEEVMNGNKRHKQDTNLPIVHAPPQPSASPPPAASPHASAPPHLSAAPVASNYRSHQITQQQPFYPIPQPYLPLYSTCPPGAEIIMDLDEILVYPSTGWSPVYKINDCNKASILSAKWKSDDDCCGCDPRYKFVLFSLQNSLIATAFCECDQRNFWTANKEHLEVIGSPDMHFGTVWIKNLNTAEVVNQSGNLLFSIQQKHALWQYHPYEIFTPTGIKVGQIDSSRGIKNRLTLAKEMPIHHKILLIFFTLYVQYWEDRRRRNRNNR